MPPKKDLETQMCDRCHEYYTVYDDDEGVWVECLCDAGYVELY